MDNLIKNFNNINIKSNNNLIQFLKDTKKIKDFTTYKDHENIIKNLLNKTYFTEFKNISKSNNCDKLIKFLSENNKFHNNQYIHQPCGSQNHPDFLIKINNKYILLECKSSKGNIPMFNSGGIKLNSLYIFSSQKDNRNTYFLGKDINPKIIDDYNKETKLLVHKLIIKRNKEVLQFEENIFGNCIYDRLALQQIKGDKKTINYFDEKSIQRENYVIEFINNL